MPLTQIEDPFGEPLDLWLSPNHEGQRRYVHPSDVLPTSVGAGTRNDTGDDNPASPTDTNDVVLCETIPFENEGNANVPTWLKQPTTEHRVPAPAPTKKTQDASQSIDPTYDPRFANESGVPSVFVTKPQPHVTCRGCSDVFLDPVVAHDGFTYCRGCVPNDFQVATDNKNDSSKGYVLTTNDLASDHGARERVAALRVLCRHGLRYIDNVAGIGRWTHEPQGCSETVAIADRKSHEDVCGFSKSTCNLPYLDDQKHAGDVDSCPMIILRHERAKHQAMCPYRLVPCSIPGCSEKKRHNRLQQHLQMCPKKTAKCPNGCPWRGRKGELIEHSMVCGLEVVACSREDTGSNAGDTVDGSQLVTEKCTYRGERRAKQAHDEVCPFRQEVCAHCKLQICARRLLKHELICPARKVTCESCGCDIQVTKLAMHKKTECHKSEMQKKTHCAFQRFGCFFSGNISEVKRHEKTDAANHLRLVSLAVEASTVSYDRWYKDVVGVRDTVQKEMTRATEHVESLTQETKRVEGDALSDTEQVQTALADMRAYYEFELGKVKESHRRSEEASAKRIQAVVTENEMLRGFLESKMTKEKVVEVEHSLREKLAECEANVLSTATTVEQHKQRWTKDVATIKNDVLAARHAVNTGTKELIQRIELHELEDDKRLERCEMELHEFNAETISDLDKLSDRQKSLERRWRDTNEKLRDPTIHGRFAEDELQKHTKLPSQTRWEATREADAAVYSSAPPKGVTERKEKEISKAVPTKASQERQRGIHAAELLFGKGSRADPSIRNG